MCEAIYQDEVIAINPSPEEIQKRDLVPLPKEYEKALNEMPRKERRSLLRKMARTMKIKF